MSAHLSVSDITSPSPAGGRPVRVRFQRCWKLVASKPELGLRWAEVGRGSLGYEAFDAVGCYQALPTNAKTG